MKAFNVRQLAKPIFLGTAVLGAVLSVILFAAQPPATTNAPTLVSTNATKPASTNVVRLRPTPPNRSTFNIRPSFSGSRSNVTASVTPGSPTPRTARPVRAGIPLPGAPAPSAASTASAGAPASNIPTPTIEGETNVIVPPGFSLGDLDPSAVLPAGTITHVQSMPLEQFLKIYAYVTGRIILRPSSLPKAPITLDATHQELTKAEAVHAMDSVLALNGITMVNVGEKFVQAVPNQEALQAGAAFSEVPVEDLPEAAQFVTKVVDLEHVLPSEVVPLIQGFSKVQNGIVPIDPSQTLVLRDYSANVKRMMEIIKKIDVEVEDYKLEVIPIKYGRVEEIYDTMNSLISGGGPAGLSSSSSGGGSSTFGSSRNRNSGMGGLNRSNPYGSSSRYGGGIGGIGGGYGGIGGAYRPYTASTPTRVSSSSRAASAVSGSSFNSRLQSVVSRMSGQGEVEVLQDAKITADLRSNSLIVFANKEDMKMITNLVSKVDRLSAQVLIESVIMDVSLTDEFEFGVSAYFNNQSGDYSQEGLMNPGSILNLITNTSSIADSGSSADGLFYLGRYKDDVTFLVRALASDGQGQILATPRIQTSHATPASFLVGETVPYVTGSYSFAGGLGQPFQQFQQLPVTTSLDVTPYITPDGLVVMDILQDINEIVGFKKFEGAGELPLTIQRSAQATVSVQDRDTIILGGFVRNSRTKSKSGIPVLKDLPLLGALFRSTARKNQRTEMVVFITPTVLPSPEDAAVLAREERDRLPGVRHLEQEMIEYERQLGEKLDKESQQRKRKSQ